MPTLLPDQSTTVIESWLWILLLLVGAAALTFAVVLLATWLHLRWRHHPPPVTTDPGGHVRPVHPVDRGIERFTDLIARTDRWLTEPSYDDPAAALLHEVHTDG